MSNKSNSKKIVQEKGICNRCGRNGHLEDKCYAKVDIIGTYIGDDDYGYNYNSIVIQQNLNNICQKCGRGGHTKEKCYAKVHIKGFYLD
ncbi:hypothetical protein Klosneuvirus_1_395 [Klosneuvirus KNV1]|uniref:CCHC-type domain-containing protein n=1 Tax=Klosneuvirus KNV1 TaxID=1977640 RepID=A0A1V0SIS9_9VIRU|nr:hypothetical protein Klosneuvirus_1_395 [Klosneuvirus KNV1]